MDSWTHKALNIVRPFMEGSEEYIDESIGTMPLRPFGFDKDILEKIYRDNFVRLYRAFYDALKEVKISDTVSIDTYDYRDKDGRRNLLSYLFMCEALKNKYEDKKIPEEIMRPTLKDMVLWTEIWSDLKESLCLGEIEWLSNHLKMKLFRIGRLAKKLAEMFET